MKKALVWNEEYEGRVAGQIERIGEASEIDGWSHHLKSKMICLPLNELINDIEIMPKIVTANPNLSLKLNQWEAVNEHWTKDIYKEYSQPMTSPSWSNGENTVYDVNDIPTTVDEQNNPILDPSYVYVAPVADESWTHVPAVKAIWEIVDDQEAIDTDNTQQALQQAVQGAISFGQQLLVEFAVENVSMGITQDGMTKTVRQVMSEVMAAIQTGSLYDAIDEIDQIPAEAKDGKYITDERLAVYKQKILDYLA